MAPNLPNQFDAAASAVTNLSQTLQDPTAKTLLTYIEADVVSINYRSSDVDLLFDQLSKYRATLQYNLNLRVSRICTIPSETLGEIFKYVCDPTSEKAITPTWLGSICQYWRQVAWSVPQLWTDLTVGRRFWRSRYQKKVLNIFFKNIRGLCCSITFLNMPREPGGEGPHRIPQETVFDLLFVKHAHKLKALTFYNTPEPWLLRITNVTKSGQGLPNLESFVALGVGGSDLFMYNLDVSLFALYNVPQLRKLSLAEVDQTLIFPWAQLTELSFLDINSPAILSIVLQCKNLVTLKLECIGDPDDIPIDLPREPVIFRNLQSFEYEGRLASHWERALANCLLFPSLERLVWLTEDGTKELRKKFLLRLPTSLSHLEIGCCGETDDIQSLEIIFARLTSLQSVVLHLNDPLDVDVVKLFMVADRRRFLPSLRSVLFLMFRREYNAQEMSNLLDIVRSRWVMHGEKDLFEGPKFRFLLAQEDSVKSLEDWITSEDV